MRSAIPPASEDTRSTSAATGSAGVLAGASEPVVLNWPGVPSSAAPPAGTALVVAAGLHGEESRIAAIEPWLSPEERERAGRFRVAGLRRRFLASRGVLREVLAACAGCRPAELRFLTGPDGKPRLGGLRPVHFNLSHSSDVMLLAVSAECALGVDVERLRPMKDALAIARRFFTPREAAWLESASAAAPDEAFFRLWTRKEAVLKACGQGIGSGLDTLELVDGSSELRRQLRHPEPRGAEWQIHELCPAAGYVGALAVSPSVNEIRCHAWLEAAGSSARTR